MSELTDIEITRLCAEAMGWKHLGAVGVVDESCKSPSEYADKYPNQLWCISGGNDWWIDPDRHNVCAPCSGIPDPLHDDAQAMALVKNFKIKIEGFFDGKWAVGDTNLCRYFYDEDLNRAICECVAQIQLQKGN